MAETKAHSQSKVVGGVKRRSGLIGTALRAVVETVTVTEAGPEAGAARLAGFTVQVAAAGAPEQAKLIVPVKPLAEIV